jgi:hypothetical protein
MVIIHLVDDRIIIIITIIIIVIFVIVVTVPVTGSGISEGSLKGYL